MLACALAWGGRPELRPALFGSPADDGQAGHSRDVADSPTAALAGRVFQIALVEDNPTDVFLIQEVLNAAGLRYRLHSFKDGELAMKYFDSIAVGQQGCPDLIILDLNIPRLSGSELLEEIRRRRMCEKTPIIVATSSAAPADRDRSTAAGATAYFVKPSQLDEYFRFGEIVRSLLQDRPQ